MTNKRRKRIDNAIEKAEEISELLEELQTEIEEIRDEEQEYFDNIPENLQGSPRYEAAEMALENLETAYDQLCVLDMLDVIEALSDAK